MEVPFGKVIYEFTHERENFCVIGRGGKNYPAVAEGILNSLCHVAARKVVYNNLGAAVCAELVGKNLNCSFGVAVNRGVGYHDAVGFNAVA